MHSINYQKCLGHLNNTIQYLLTTSHKQKFVATDTSATYLIWIEFFPPSPVSIWQTLLGFLMKWLLSRLSWCCGSKREACNKPDKMLLNPLPPFHPLLLLHLRLVVHLQEKQPRVALVVLLGRQQQPRREVLTIFDSSVPQHTPCCFLWSCIKAGMRLMETISVCQQPKASSSSTSPDCDTLKSETRGLVIYRCCYRALPSYIIGQLCDNHCRSVRRSCIVVPSLQLWTSW